MVQAWEAAWRQKFMVHTGEKPRVHAWRESHERKLIDRKPTDGKPSFEKA